MDAIDYGERPRLIADESAPELGLEAAGVEAQTEPVPAPEKAQASSPSRTPARRGKRAVAFWLDPVAHKQLRTLALRLDTNLQALMEEACNDLFRQHGMHRIAGGSGGSDQG